MIFFIILLFITSTLGAGPLSVPFFNFELSVFRILLIGFLFVALIQILKQKKDLLLQKQKNFYSRVFYALWFGWALFSFFWVKDQSAWLRAVFFIGLGTTMVFLFPIFLKDRRDFRKLILAAIPLVVFHNLIGWLEFFTKIYLFYPKDKMTAAFLKAGAPVSSFGNANNYALFLMFAIPALSGLYPFLKTKIKKNLMKVLIISCILLLLLTESRAALFGLIIGYAPEILRFIRWLGWRRILAAILILILLDLIIMPMLGFDYLYPVRQILPASFYLEDSSDSVRINLIENGFDILSQTKGIGSGAGNIEYWMEMTGSRDTSGLTNIHNWWLEILVGYGIPIFLLYIAFYLKLITDVLKRYHSSGLPMEKETSKALLRTLLGFIIGSIGASSNISAEWLWVFFALIISYQGLPPEDEPIQNS